MLIHKALAFVSLAAVASAFLIPAGLSTTEINSVIDNIRVNTIYSPENEQISIACPGCPVALIDETGFQYWKHGIASELEFTFSIGTDKERTGGTDLLLLNGRSIYPVFKKDEAIPVVQKSSGGRSELPLGFMAKYSPVIKAEKDNLELLTVTVDIKSIGGLPVSGLDMVTINVIKAPGGQMMIASTDVIPSKVVPSGEKCTSIACQIKAKLENLRLTRPIHPKKGCGKKASPFGFPSGAPRPHHRHGAGQRHRGAFLRSVHEMIAAALQGILMVVVFVALGMAAFFIGMLLGTIAGNFVILLWRVFYRRGQKASCCNGAAEDVVDAKELNKEAEPFMDHQEPPPVYENVIVVEEKSAL